MVAELNRRGLITGLISFVAAPAIVRASSLMPVKALVSGIEWKITNMPNKWIGNLRVGDWVIFPETELFDFAEKYIITAVVSNNSINIGKI